jgi:hypothetical protein
MPQHLTLSPVVHDVQTSRTTNRNRLAAAMGWTTVLQPFKVLAGGNNNKSGAGKDAHAQRYVSWRYACCNAYCFPCTAISLLGAVRPETVSVVMLVTSTYEQAHRSTYLVLCVSPCV